jgi:tRNA (adenine37-N6)-methyltransferase
MTLPPITYMPIGIIYSEHTAPERTPIQPIYARGCTGRVEIFPEYAPGLLDVEGFSHLYLLYHFHRGGAPRLLVEPFLQDVARGVFATRAPCRPNALGLSIVRLIRRDGAVLHLQDVDILNGTPLLDLKPYTARFDRIETTHDGWHVEVDEEKVARRGGRGYDGPREGGSHAGI